MANSNGKENVVKSGKELIAQYQHTFKPEIKNYKLSPEPLKYYPDMTDGKIPKILDTKANLEYLLNFFHIKIRYNLMTRRREINIPQEIFLSDENENACFEMIENIATLNSLPTKRLDKRLDNIAWDNPYHPIREMIKENPWDGVSRLPDFIDTLHSKDRPTTLMIVKTWMCAAIAAAFSDDGFTNQGVLVLQGGQGIGKTTFAKKLDPINCGAVQLGACLDPTSKDDILSLSRFWIVELGELDVTFRKADIARLKSFITKNADHVRAPYAMRESTLFRRTAYIATVNDPNYLVDQTGNRRWWTVELESIDDVEFDMVQVWAEVYRLWELEIIKPELSKENQAAINKINESHQKIDPLEEKVLDFFDWDAAGRSEKTCTQVLEMLNMRISPTDANNMSRVLEKITEAKPRRTEKGRFFLIPPQSIR